MMTTKFTPAPWVAYDNYVQAKVIEDDPAFSGANDVDCICLMPDWDGGNFEQERKANARLIAESPEMFELVKAIAHIGIDFGYGRFELDEDHINKARELVEKIEGE